MDSKHEISLLNCKKKFLGPVTGRDNFTRPRSHRVTAVTVTPQRIAITVVLGIFPRRITPGICLDAHCGCGQGYTFLQCVLVFLARGTASFESTPLWLLFLPEGCNFGNIHFSFCLVCDVSPLRTSLFDTYNEWGKALFLHRLTPGSGE